MKTQAKDKKGQLAAFGSLAVGITTLVIVLAVGFLIMANVRTQIVATDPNVLADNVTECWKSVACNATMQLQSATDTIPGWIPIVVVTAIGAALLGLVKLFNSKA